jgi:transketolase
VQVALDARDLLQSHGIPGRVVSMPCVGWFAAQDLAYRDVVLPPGIRRGPVPRAAQEGR